MPYYLVPYKKTMFRVMDSTGKFYSNKGLTRSNALQQQKALYANETVSGAGLFSDAIQKVKEIGSNVLKIAGRETGKLLRNDFPPDARRLIEKYKNYTITHIVIRREPIKSFVDVALNAISLGRWRRAKKELNYDKLFHLSAVVSLIGKTGDVVELMIEKNQVINITKSFKTTSNMQFINVPVNEPITFGDFLNNAVKLEGNDFFKYDAFKYNCQRFINALLTANNLNSPAFESFILQNVDSLLQRLPSYVSPFAKITTNIAGLADIALQGRGAPTFQKQLTDLNIQPDVYLKTARKFASLAGYDERALNFATNGIHKLIIYDDSGDAHSFGRVGYNDFIIWSALEKLGKVNPGYALKKRNVFIKSHSKIKGDWKANEYSPNNLSLRILWADF